MSFFFKLGLIFVYSFIMDKLWMSARRDSNQYVSLFERRQLGVAQKLSEARLLSDTNKKSNAQLKKTANPTWRLRGASLGHK